MTESSFCMYSMWRKLMMTTDEMRKEAFGYNEIGLYKVAELLREAAFDIEERDKWIAELEKRVSDQDFWIRRISDRLWHEEDCTADAKEGEECDCDLPPEVDARRQQTLAEYNDEMNEQVNI